MSIDRSRNKLTRKSKRVILVSYEGENKTEQNYFSNFSGRDKDYVIKPVLGNETDPVHLVKQTIQKVQDLSLDLSEDDKAFCIFDTDMEPEKDKQIEEAIKLAKAYNIIPIVSAPCVELWFLLHFDYTTAIISSNDVIKRLKNFINKMVGNCNLLKQILIQKCIR